MHGGKRSGAGRPGKPRTAIVRLPYDLGKWLQRMKERNPKVIEFLKRDDVREDLEVKADELTTSETRD